LAGPRQRYVQRGTDELYALGQPYGNWWFRCVLRSSHNKCYGRPEQAPPRRVQALTDSRHSAQHELGEHATIQDKVPRSFAIAQRDKKVQYFSQLQPGEPVWHRVPSLRMHANGSPADIGSWDQLGFTTHRDPINRGMKNAGHG
jgi:hypothetical protein